MRYQQQSSSGTGEPVSQIIKCVIDLALIYWRKLPKNGLKQTLKEVWLRGGPTIVDERGERQIPLLIEKEQTHYGWYLKFHLPNGWALTDVHKMRDELAWALKADIEFWEGADHLLHMRLFTIDVPDIIHYASEFATRFSEYPFAVPLGLSKAGLEYHDFVKDCHMLIGGMTNQGKSVLLRIILTAIHEAYTPEQVELTLIDMKNGTEFKVFKNSTHTKQWAGSLDMAIKALIYVNKELNRRSKLLEPTPFVDLVGYNKHVKEKLPFHLVVVDEFAQVDKRVKELVDRLLAMGRYVGIYCIICTQRPDRDVLPGTLKANIPSTIALKVRNGVNSEILLDRGNIHAALLPPIQGRAIVQHTSMRTMQVLWLSPEDCQQIISKYTAKPSSTPPTTPLKIVPTPK